ncbi:MAG: hypothetical protein EBS01_04020, partial [Verrucomicrobia bacterium]|nr:hypothetical protein [Verrucomicrobiota bacterium]
MFGYRARGFSVLVAGGQCLAVFAAYFFAGQIGGVTGGTFASSFLYGLWPWIMGIVGEALWRNSGGTLAHSPSLGTCCVRTMAAAVLASLVGGERFGDPMNPAATVAHLAVGIALLIATHWLLPRLFTKIVFYDQHIHRVVVVGNALQVADLARLLKLHHPLGIAAVGWLAENTDALGLLEETGLPHLGTVADLREVVNQEGVDQVILAGTSSEKQVGCWKTECERLGVRLVVAQSLALAHPGHFRWEAKGDWCFGVAYAEPLQSPVYRLVKRVLDIAVALPALLLVVLPVALVTMLMQRRESPGPLFYRQWRHGRRNRPFQVWKFRTMHVQAAQTVPASVQARREDPRV